MSATSDLTVSGVSLDSGDSLPHAETRPRLLPLLQGRFRWLFVAQLLSVVGDRVGLIVAPLALLQFTRSASVLGVAMSIVWLPKAVMALAGGVLGDRMPRRRVLQGCLSARAAVLFVVAAVLVSGRGAMNVLVPLMVLAAALESAGKPCVVGMLPQLVRPDELRSANALIHLPDTLGWLVGAPVAGVLVVVAGPGAGYGVAAAFVLLGALAVTRLHAPGIDRPSAHVHESPLRAIVSGAREIWTRQWLIGLLAMQALFGLLVIPTLTVLGPILLAGPDGAGRDWAIVNGAIGLGSAIGVVLAPRVRASRPALMVCLYGAVGSAQPIVVATGAPIAVMAAGIVFASACLFCAGVIWETTLQRVVPMASLSRVVSVDLALQGCLIPIGLLLVGPVAGVTGQRLALVLAGATIAALALLLACTRRIRAVEATFPPLPAAA